MNPFEQAGIKINAQMGGTGGGKTDSILNQISTGRTATGQRIVIGAQEKVGKTSLGCDAPRALLIPLEQGFVTMNVPKTPMLHSFDAVMQLLAEVKTQCMAGTFQPRSLIFDSLSALERLIHDAVLRRDPTYGKGNAKALTMEAALGGYGKAYSFANELFGEFLAACDELVLNAGINIICTCHVFAAKQIDPAFGEYDQWDLLLHSPKNNKTYGKREMLTQWADLIGFLHEPMFITKGEGNSNFNQAASLRQGRVLAVDRTPGYVAGNRYGIKGNVPIPDPSQSAYGSAWNSLAHAIYNSCGIDVFNRD